jgi:hypothetical protein
VRTESDDLEPYLERLRALPFVRAAEVDLLEPRVRGRMLDASIALETLTKTVRLPVELKRGHLAMETVEQLLHMAAGLPDLLLCAPVVGRGIAARLVDAGVNFIDLAGNCHIRIGDRYLARVQGEPALRPLPSERALRFAGYRVLFALLAAPELATSNVRAIAEAAGGVSLGTAAGTRAHLLERGALVESARRTRWAPGGWKATRDELLAGFSTTLIPPLVLGRFRARERDVRPLERRLEAELPAGRWRWGGGAACERLTHHFRGDRTTIYLDETAAVEVSPRALALVADPRGPVALVRRPGPVAFQSPQPATVHPLLAYADLLAEGDERARDGAREMYDAHLARLEATA